LQNFETLKLATSEPYNPVILALLVLAIAVSCRKQTTRFLDRTQTDQLKGLAILLVVIGHLGYHAITPQAALTFGSEGVALFLMLSGFGLTRSSFHAPPLALAVHRQAGVARVPPLLAGDGAHSEP
jgi:hypothetical protein